MFLHAIHKRLRRHLAERIQLPLPNFQHRELSYRKNSDHAGKTFIDRWGEKTAAELIARFQVTADDPFFQFADMKDETTVDITAYVLQVNGAKAGPQPLTRKTAVLVSSITR